MPQNLSKLGAVLLVAVIAAGMGVLVPTAFAQPTHVAQTGQSTSYAPGDDGAIQAGVPFPSPCVTDRRNGTVRDHLMGLIWLKDAGCLGSWPWADALAAIEHLNQGTDFSCVEYRVGTFTAWHLPNVREIHSLIDFAFLIPALSDAAGTGQWTPSNAFSGDVLLGLPGEAMLFGSSTTLARTPDNAWYISLATGVINVIHKGSTFHVWPVRSGL
jgi:Protein of unknown function (DUF1566)